MAVSPDGTKIAAGCRDVSIRTYDIDTSTLLFHCKGHTADVNSVVFSPNGRRIVSWSRDCTVRIWDGATGLQTTSSSLCGHIKSVSSVSFSPDGKYIASASYDKSIRIWDATVGSMENEPLHGHSAWVNQVAFTSNGTRLVFGPDDKTVK